MRQIFLEKGELAIKEVCEPSLDDYSVLISVSYSYLSTGNGLKNLLDSSQDLFFKNIPNKVKKIIDLVASKGLSQTSSIIKNKLNNRTFVFGHSCSGIVLAVGKKVRNFKVGDLVACAGPGFAAHADIVCVPENLVVHIKNDSLLRQACLTGLGAMALQSIRRASLQLGETVAVIGLDTVGQLIMRLANLSGCNVIGIDNLKSRLELAQTSGFKYVYDFEKDNLEQSINIMTGYKGVDCVIASPDCAENSLYEKAFSILRKSGKFVITGSKGISLPNYAAYNKEVDLLFSMSYGPGRHDPLYEYHGQDYPFQFVRWTENRNLQLFSNLLESKKIDVDDLVQDYFSVDRVPNLLDEVQQKKKLGLVVDFTDKKIQQKSEKVTTFIPSVKDSLSISVSGIGKFTKATLYPFLKKLDKAKLELVVDEDVNRVIRGRKLFKKSEVCVGGAESLVNTQSNVVFVSPSVDISVTEVISLLSQKKAVFIAHPLTFNMEELNTLEAFLNMHPESNLCIGRYRSFSPLIKKIKNELVNRFSPLMITYRLNVNLADKEELTHPQWSAGRVIAQGAHIFDLFYYLTGAKPTSISVDNIRPTFSNIFPTDNFMAQVSFSDGSLCSLLLTSLGHEEIASERMEIYFDSKAIIMEDYMFLKGYGLSPAFNERLRVPNSGYNELLDAFFNSLTGQNKKPIDNDRLINVAKLSISADSFISLNSTENEILL
jgi:threonine dehydrogenase-like Zn-dependent dehydrogenase/predicted dehydrogenase